MRRPRWMGGVGAALVAALAASVLAPQAANADGTEQLGAPSIDIATGSGIASGGVGLHTQPGTATVTVPDGATVKQVLLYWEGQFVAANDFPGDFRPGDATIVANGAEYTGRSIGGPSDFFWGGSFGYNGYIQSEAFRADVTGQLAVAPGANSITFSGLDNTFVNNGASVVVIYQEAGKSADLILRDGLDLAYFDFAPPLDTTVPVTYTFPAEPVDRTAQLTLIAGSVGNNRPNLLDVTANGSTTTIVDPFTDNGGREWDNVTVPVTIPAGATTVTVQAMSAKQEGDARQPASLAWVTGALSVPRTPPPPPPVTQNETATGAGTQWPETRNWFMYSKFTTSKVDLIAGQHIDVGDITMRRIDKTWTSITITMHPGWRFSNGPENLKIHDMATAPTTYVQPGAYNSKFLVTTNPVTVRVPTANSYGIHGDVERVTP